MVYKIFYRNLKFFNSNISYWMILILYEFDVKKNIFKAREIFDRALSLNK